MSLHITEPINVFLDWDYLDGTNVKQIGTYDAEEEIQEERFDISFHLFLEVVMQYDCGNYDTPPESTELGVDCVISDVRIHSVSGEEIIPTIKQLDNLIAEIKENITYE